jgi:hypothetical protein
MKAGSISTIITAVLPVDLAVRVRASASQHRHSLSAEIRRIIAEWAAREDGSSSAR